MDKINVKWEVNVESGNLSFDLEELEVKSIDEWDSLSTEDQKERLQNAIDDSPEEVCRVLVNWKHECNNVVDVFKNINNIMGL